MPQPAAQATLPPGTLLAKRYRIEELIGSGGYASVYRATDQTFGYERAIKEVIDTDSGVRQQFKLESELLINTKHPNVPHGFSLFEDRNRLYLVMEYVRGKDLEELLNESLTQRKLPLDEAQVLAWMIDVCGALDEMHTLHVPIIHRDIKPANIKVSPEGRPVLIDFGLAKLHRAGRPTMTAAQGVSPGFAPPEQYMAKGRTDARTDIYGLGATLYACLTGKDPPEAPSRLLAQTGAPGSGGASLIAVRKRNARVSEATDRLITRALELSPTHRQQSAGEMRDEMIAALRQLQAPAPSVEPVRQFAAPPTSMGSTGKRPVAGGGTLMRTTGKQPAVGPAAQSAPPLAERRSGKQPAVPAEARGDQRGRSQVDIAARATGVQPAIFPEQSTAGRYAAATSNTSAGTLAPTGSGYPLMAATPTGQAAQAPHLAYTAPGVSSAGSQMRAGTAVKVSAPPALAVPSGAWLRFGTLPLSAFGKVMLALSVVEVLWGAVVLGLGGVALATENKPFPVWQFALIWAVVLLLLSVVGGQALSRPVFRRGRVTPLRRSLQGTGLVLYTVLVHAVAVWGAHIFSADQSNPTLAIVAFMLFGVNVLVVGGLAVVNTLS